MALLHGIFQKGLRMLIAGTYHGFRILDKMFDPVYRVLTGNPAKLGADTILEKTMARTAVLNKEFFSGRYRC